MTTKNLWGQLPKTATIASLKQILRLEGIDFSRRHLLIFDEIQLLDDPSNLLKRLFWKK